MAPEGSEGSVGARASTATLPGAAQNGFRAAVALAGRSALPGAKMRATGAAGFGAGVAATTGLGGAGGGTWAAVCTGAGGFGTGDGLHWRQRPGRYVRAMRPMMYGHQLGRLHHNSRWGLDAR